MVKSYPYDYATQVDEREWVSQEEAARILDIALLRVGVLIASGHLVPAVTTSRSWGSPPTLTPGVTRSSVTQELEWRRSSSLMRRGARIVRDIVNWI